MDIPRKRSFNDILSGVYLMSHPIPVLLHMIGVAMFALLAALPHPVWGIVVLVIAAHGAMQISIAMLNDYCDRRLDTLSKPEKPIPRGLIQPREALFGGLLMMVVMGVLLLPLNWLAIAISLCYLALAQGYNLGLKSTPWSGIVFALAIPLIPLYAFAGVGHAFPVLFWLVPEGFLLGVALNLASSLPDVEEDAANHARTLAVVLGVRRSFLACHLLIALGALLMGLLAVTRRIPAQGWIIGPTLLVTLFLVGVLALRFGPEKPVATRRLHFYLASITCILLAGGWLVGVIA
jgi:4-hydroxybenzoate polyprenyltransferase